MAAVLAVCCVVCCGPYRLLCGGGVPCGGKHIIIIIFIIPHHRHHLLGLICMYVCKDSAAPVHARTRAHRPAAPHQSSGVSQTPHPTACPQAGIRHSTQTTIVALVCVIDQGEGGGGGRGAARKLLGLCTLWAGAGAPSLYHHRVGIIFHIGLLRANCCGGEGVLGVS